MAISPVRRGRPGMFMSCDVEIGRETTNNFGSNLTSPFKLRGECMYA